MFRWVEKTRPKPFTITRRELLRAASGLPVAYAYPFGDYLKIRQPLPGFYDVVVYGATWAGINAAYTAALAGCRVALLAVDNGPLGGMSGNGGLSTVDMGYYPKTIGGVAWCQFQSWCAADGTVTSQNGVQWPSQFGAFGPSSVSTNPGYLTLSLVGPANIWQPQAQTLRSVLEATAAGWLPPNPPVSGINVFFNASLQTFAGSVYPSVIMQGTAASSGIKALVTNAGTFTGSVFIDATDVTDILAAVARNTGGHSYAVGRESTAAYSESLAGVQPGSAVAIAGATLNTTPFPLIANPSRTTGAADNAVQTMTYRVPIQKISSGGIAFTQPTGYNAANYANAGLYLTANSVTTMAAAITLYNSQGTNKNTTNDGVAPMSMVNQSWVYPDATPTQRAAIVTSHAQFMQGLYYYLQTSSGVPAALNTDVATYGLDPNAYPNNVVNGISYWPGQIYMREGRRPVNSSSDAPGFKGTAGAAAVQTQADVTTGATKTHQICRTSQPMDIHNPMAYVQDNTHYVPDGNYFITSGYGNTPIQMEVLYADTTGCPNFMHPMTPGCSHIAWGPIRTECPTQANMGEAAGFIAAIVAKGVKGGSATVQGVNYTTQLQPLLQGIGATLT